MARPLRFHAPDRATWARWLEDYGERVPEVSLVFYRKSAGRSTITYDEAVEDALVEDGEPCDRAARSRRARRASRGASTRRR